ncbi:MAG: aspartyl protease family protein [Nitrososphaeria archaeon]|nr:aspartyl protease family protein [Nitrososphaeria archaeon]
MVLQFNGEVASDHVWVKAKIGDPDCGKIVEVDALVDTEATLMVIPRRLANELGLKVTGKAVPMTAGGSIELERTRIWVELESKEDLVSAVVSNVIDKVLIGVTTLEVLGLQVDPVTGKLKEWTLLLYQSLT